MNDKEKIKLYMSSAREELCHVGQSEMGSRIWPSVSLHVF